MTTADGHAQAGKNPVEPEDAQELRKKPELLARGRRLKQARKMRNLTQRQLAEGVGVGQTAISRYELGIDDPGGITLQRILTVLEIQYQWYHDGSGTMDVQAHAISAEVIEIARALDRLPKNVRERLIDAIKLWLLSHEIMKD
jgi:transcriptional regulator with XRE-family HTH domain